MRQIIILMMTMFFVLGCGSSATTSGGNGQNQNADSNDPKYQLSYKGLRFFAPALSQSSYSLEQVDDKVFESLSKEKKRQVADKLLATLFFGYPHPVLETKIDQGNFISSLFADFTKDLNDKAAVEEEIRNTTRFFHSSYSKDEVNHILSRFYVMDKIDSYYLQNWIAYILTQTIMFSPAYELDSSHEPNIARVYNAMVRSLEEESTIGYSTYLHMISSDNWRRFRSPEDNGREMMEIYALLFEDNLVPLAGKALQNWKLDRDNDTLVIGLNENTQPLQLFGTTVVNGDDFYRELAKSSAFQKGVVSRLVDFFFTTQSQTQKDRIVSKIVHSAPQRWEDIVLQIIFSKTYLLESSRPKSAEELFYSLAKKTEYKHYKYTFENFSKALDQMHQSAMKYKLGKLDRVPMDTLSFINYHKFIRENLMIRHANPKKVDNYKSWDSYGFTDVFIAEDRFSLNENDPKGSLDTLIDYLFTVTVSRKPIAKEITLFETHMLQQDNGTLVFSPGFNLTKSSDRTNAAILILDYISRLAELYQYPKVDA